MHAQVDLSNCDREPIQCAGAIRPRGALLVLQEPELRIRQASANSIRYPGIEPDALLRQGIEVLLGAATTANRRERLSAHGLADGLAHLMTVQLLASDRPCRLFATRTADGRHLLELEPVDESARIGAPDLYPGVHGTLQRLQAAPTLAAFSEHTVTEIRARTGFDRVMADRFDADGSGEVIAESVRATPIHRSPRHRPRHHGRTARILRNGGAASSARCASCLAPRRRRPPHRSVPARNPIPRSCRHASLAGRRRR